MIGESMQLLPLRSRQWRITGVVPQHDDQFARRHEEPGTAEIEDVDPPRRQRASRASSSLTSVKVPVRSRMRRRCGESPVIHATTRRGRETADGRRSTTSPPDSRMKQPGWSSAAPAAAPTTGAHPRRLRPDLVGTSGGAISVVQSRITTAVWRSPVRTATRSADCRAAVAVEPAAAPRHVRLRDRHSSPSPGATRGRCAEALHCDGQPELQRTSSRGSRADGARTAASCSRSISAVMISQVHSSGAIRASATRPGGAPTVHAIRRRGPATRSAGASSLRRPAPVTSPRRARRRGPGSHRGRGRRHGSPSREVRGGG